MPLNCVDLVNAVQTEEELEAVRRSVTRSGPYGSERFCGQTAQQLGLQASMRSQGRPRKNPETMHLHCFDNRNDLDTSCVPFEFSRTAKPRLTPFSG